LEPTILITLENQSNKKEKSSREKEKEGEEKTEDSQTNGKKNPYDLRNKSQEKITNFYNDKIGESMTLKNEYEFSKSNFKTLAL